MQIKVDRNFYPAEFVTLHAIERTAFTLAGTEPAGVQRGLPLANLWFLSFRKKGTARRGLSDKVVV